MRDAPLSFGQALLGRTAAPATNTAHASERTLLQARRDAIQALTVFLGTADLFLPHTGAQDDPRQRLTGALERAIQLAQRRA
jgi:hypothetical protein